MNAAFEKRLPPISCATLQKMGNTARQNLTTSLCKQPLVIVNSAKQKNLFLLDVKLNSLSKSFTNSGLTLEFVDKCVYSNIYSALYGSAITDLKSKYQSFQELKQFILKTLALNSSSSNESINWETFNGHLEQLQNNTLVSNLRWLDFAKLG